MPKIKKPAYKVRAMKAGRKAGASAEASHRIVRKVRPVPADVQAILDNDGLKLQAQEGLTKLHKMRYIAEAVQERRPQEEVARALNMSQPTVSRMVSATKRAPELLETTPTELIEQRLVGTINTPTMMRRLLKLNYVGSQQDPTGGDGYRAGTFDAVERAFSRGMLTPREYKQLLRSTPRSKPVRGDR